MLITYLKEIAKTQHEIKAAETKAKKKVGLR